MPVKLTSDIQAVKVLREKDSESLYGAVRHIKNRVIGKSILLTKTTAAQNEVALSYH